MQSREQSYLESNLSPTAAKILSVRKVHPRGAIPIFLEDGPIAADQLLPANLGVPMFFAAAFSTRSQVASQLRDTPEPVALHSFSVMATSTILAHMNTYGINLPVFGVMFDRNMVRFHVDWSMIAHAVSKSVCVSSTGTVLKHAIETHLCSSSTDQSFRIMAVAF
jgi:hypothetical protein